MQSVFKVDPSICGVRFFRRSQAGPSPPLAEALPFWAALLPDDHPLELGHPLPPPRPGGPPAPRLGICRLLADLPPQRSCPMGVRFDEATEEDVRVAGPLLLQESGLGLTSEPIPPKLQVDEVRPKVFSAALLFPDAAWLPEVMVDLDNTLISRPAVAAEPGVRVGSSSGFFIPGPFHGLPGSNSGMPKVSSPLVELSLFPVLVPEALVMAGEAREVTVPDEEALVAVESGHPLEPLLVGALHVSSIPNGNPEDVCPGFMEPGALKSSLIFHLSSLEPLGSALLVATLFAMSLPPGPPMLRVEKRSDTPPASMLLDVPPPSGGPD